MPKLPEVDRLARLENVFKTMVGVQPEELVAAVDTLIDQMNAARAELKEALEELDSRTSGEFERVRGEVRTVDEGGRAALSQSLRQLLSEHEATVSDLRSTFSDELERIEALIPDLPPEFDASDLQTALEAHQSVLDRLSDLTTGENLRNALEALPEGEKLAISAIEGLEARLQERLAQSQGTTALIARYLYQIGDVNVSGAADGDVLTYDSTTRTWTAEAPGGGPGGSVTVETPTGSVDAANTAFTVSDTPKWIVSDGITYFDGAGYSIAGLNVTMDVPPSSFIRAII